MTERNVESDFVSGSLGWKMISEICRGYGFQVVDYSNNMTSQSLEKDGALRMSGSEWSVEAKLDNHDNTGNLQFSYMKNMDTQRRWTSEADFILILRWNMKNRSGDGVLYILATEALFDFFASQPDRLQTIHNYQHKVSSYGYRYGHDQTFVLVKIEDLKRFGIIKKEVHLANDRCKKILKKVG